MYRKKRASNYLKQKVIEMQGKIDESIIIGRELDTFLPKMDRSGRHNISKNIVTSMV